jgi:chromosome partitioning protein
MEPLGYVIMQHAVRLDRPVHAHARWMDRIPPAYRESVLGEQPQPGVTIDRDTHCLATLKPFRSLMPLAKEARKPMFFLKPADGALGGHAKAVQDCYGDFRELARAVAKRCGLALP